MTFFSFDGETFEIHATEEEARAEAKRAMEFWSDDAGDGWDELSTQVCYGRVTHAVKVTRIPVTDENRHMVPSGGDATAFEEHSLEAYDNATVEVNSRVPSREQLEQALREYVLPNLEVLCDARVLSDYEAELLRKLVEGEPLSTPEDQSGSQNLALWECDSCGKQIHSDPLAGDDWGGEMVAVGPDCPDCDQAMDLVEDTPEEEPPNFSSHWNESIPPEPDATVELDSRGKEIPQPGEARMPETERSALGPSRSGVGRHQNRGDSNATR